MSTTPDSKLGPVARRLAATRRVLCIEDEPDVAGFFRAYFRAAGYDLVHVDPENTAAIIAALEEFEPDLMLLDVRFRGFSGMEAYRAMRSEDRWAFTPVIVVSAHAAVDPDFEAPKGIDAFMPKPFNTNVLADLVRERIEAAHALAEVGRTEELRLFTKDYLAARMTDEIAVAGDQGTFAFALVALRSMGDVVTEVGNDGLNHLTTALIDKARPHLPAGTIIGLTDTDEVALLFPGVSAPEAKQALEEVIAALVGDFSFAGGASVPVSLAGGVADYPTHATDPDGLFMAADAALADAVDAGKLIAIAL